MGAPTPVRHQIINPGGGQTRVPGPVGVDPDDGHLLTDHARNDQLAAIGRPAGPAFELRIGRECHEIRAVRISGVNVAGGIQTEVGNPLPIGDQEGVPAMSSFGNAVMPVPSTLMTCSTEFLVNASRVPSGDHVGPSSNAKSSGPGSGVTCRKPVPSALMMEIRPMGPPDVSSTVRNAIWQPSGDHTGVGFSVRPPTIGVATPSSTSMMYMAVTPMSVFLENAIRRPIGEIAGSNPASAPASGCLPEPFG